MIRTLMHAKLHGAHVTEADLNYRGSITIDRELIEAVGMLPHEKVQIVNKANGARFETYVIEGSPGSGCICVNGAAARLVSVGDEVLIIAYGAFTEQEARGHEPKVAILTPENKILELNG
ncbi:MAG: aspartate 1-decarboxylase [Planctomycetota bacterium]|jgi:aspartate 1-decarboxylase